jgi:hypothetical protein
MGHDLLKLLLLLLVPEVVLLLVIALAVVIPLGVVKLVGGVELLPLRAVGDEVRGDLLLSLRNLCKAQKFLASRAISSSGMLSYCSSEAAVKEDKSNSKADKTVVLMMLASWSPTRALVIKALLVREAS